MAYSWTELADREAARAADRLERAEALYKRASEVFEADRTRENRIGLMAARRVLREAAAIAQEWVDGR